MKGTDLFKKTIQAYLEQRATEEALFAPRYANPKKNCTTCILNAVKESGCCGFADEEVYSMAVHYYDEENINVGNPIGCNVAVNRIVELTEEEKQQAHEKAKQQAQEQAYAKIMQPKKKVKQPDTSAIFPTLF